MAGLAAALSLAETGLRPLVLEASPQAGGRYATVGQAQFSHDGRQWTFPLDHGVHGWWSQYRNLRRLLLRHGLLPQLQRAQRQAWVYSHGTRSGRAEIGQRLITSPLPAPLHYLWLLASPSFLRMMGPAEWLMTPWVGITLLAMLAFDPMRDGEALAGRSALQVLRGWPPMLRAFGWALARSGLAAGVESAPLSGFIALFRFYSLPRRDAIAFDYLPGDSGSLVIDPLVQRITALGGDVRCGMPVTGLEPTAGGGWQVHAGGEALQATQVVLATDAPAAQRLLQAAGGMQPAIEHVTWPEGQPSAVVRLWFDITPEIDAEGGMFGGANYTLDNFFWVHRIQRAFRSWHEATGGSALECHIYGPPDLLAEGDEAILAHAMADVHRAWPGLREHLVHAALQRNPPVHTLFGVGTTQHTLGVETPWPGLYACGDWVRHPAPALFLERATLTGLAAANAVRRALGAGELPLEPYAEPEPLAKLSEVVLRGVRLAVDAVVHRLGK